MRDRDCGGLQQCEQQLERNLQGRGEDISYSVGGGRAAKVMSNCGYRVRVGRRL